jgi:hypothetical protein
VLSGKVGVSFVLDSNATFKAGIDDWSGATADTQTCKDLGQGHRPLFLRHDGVALEPCPRRRTRFCEHALPPETYGAWRAAQRPFEHDSGRRRGVRAGAVKRTRRRRRRVPPFGGQFPECGTLRLLESLLIQELQH